MSYYDDELDDRLAREHQWFDAGAFFGLLIGGTVALLYYHGSALEWIAFFALWGVLHHFKALQKVRHCIDWVEARVKRWAGL